MSNPPLASVRGGERPLGRRDFVRGALLACGAVLGGIDVQPLLGAPVRQALRIGLAAPPGAGEALLRGVTLGVEEAARTGEMLGRTVELHPLSRGAELGPAVRQAGLSVLIGGANDGAATAKMAEASAAAGIILLNAGAAADELRGEGCRRGVFHVQASERMYADALAAAPEAGATRAVLWHPTLERFGAAQLNDRFRARFATEMEAGAWAGWMAVKIAWEASLRARSTDAAALLAYLERPTTQFDGHKGWPLSFRPWDRQLRQPLYLVQGADPGTVVGEVPVRSAEGGRSSQAQLDRIGATQSTSPCRDLAQGSR